MIGEVMTREQKIDFERRHSQVCRTFTYFKNFFTFTLTKSQATLLEESQLTSLQTSTIENRTNSYKGKSSEFQGQPDDGGYQILVQKVF